MLSKEFGEEIQCLTGDIKQMKDRVDLFEHKMEKKDVQYDVDLDEKGLWELQLNQLQLRFQAVPELSGEDN